MENVFQPYQRVLVRNDNFQVWIADFFSHIEKTFNNHTVYITTGGKHWLKCIPYVGNENLHNTTNSASQNN